MMVSLLSVVPLKIGNNNCNPGETHRKNAVYLGYFLKLIYPITCLFMDFQRYRSNDRAGDVPFSMP